MSSACVNGRDCALVGCDQGIEVDFVHPYGDPGNYTITVDVDGQTTTCTVTLPPPDAPGRLCDHDVVGVRLGFADPSAQQRSLLGVGVSRTDARSVTIHVAKDGGDIASGTFTPAYATTAPSGSDCDPKSCTFAKQDFP